MPELDCSPYFPSNWSEGIFNLIEWQAGDVVISAGAKQGNTWMQNIAHQLRTSGDEDFETINNVCPRTEYIQSPSKNDAEHWLRHNWENGVFKRYDFRILSTHVPPPKLPVNGKVKYIIPVRNGKDTLVSLYKYRNKTTDEFKRLWGGQSFPSFDVCFECYLQQQPYWKMFNSWLPYRHQNNVLMIHFSDLKKDLEGNIRVIADFIGLSVQPDKWSGIVDRCSFKWMKEHAHHFEPCVNGISMLQRGAMIREGKINSYKNLFSREQLKRWNSIHEQLLPDKDIRRWCDEGGVLPL